MTLFPKVKRLLDEQGMGDVLITGGGIIPAEDAEALREIGVGRLFTPGTTTAEAAEYISSWVEARDAAAAADAPEAG
jgi:methylmalonyl-CoA mutase C-terminal domain/subunit